MLKIANKRFRGRFLFFPINADASYLPLRNSSISGIVSVAMIHHIPTKILRIKFIEECFRVLSKRGIIIMTSWSIIKPKHFLLSLWYYVLSFVKGERIEFGDVYISWAKKYNRFFHLFSVNEMVSLFKKFKILGYFLFGKSFLRENILIIALKL